MRNFFSPLKAREAYLRFVFFTGITKFSQVSIFSELNNVTNVSMYDEYAGMLGITKEELSGQLSEDIEVLATKMHLTKEQTLDKLTENYDGYHFQLILLMSSTLTACSIASLRVSWVLIGLPQVRQPILSI